MADRLAGLGIEFAPERIVTAASAGAAHLRAAHPGAGVYALVEQGQPGTSTASGWSTIRRRPTWCWWAGPTMAGPTSG